MAGTKQNETLNVVKIRKDGSLTFLMKNYIPLSSTMKRKIIAQIGSYPLIRSK